VIILETIHQISDAEKAALKVQLALENPFMIEGHEIKVTVSIGISFYSQNGLDTDRLLRAADYAMYMAKREGGNRHLSCIPGGPDFGGPCEEG
jgi:diguanylate cyclase (GGDEF)-like protein